MIKTIKRSLPVLLAITILLGSTYIGLSELDLNERFVVQANAASESDLTFMLNSDGLSYSVSSCKSSAKGKLVIPSTYKDKPVTRIGQNAFKECERINSITIPESIKSIGADAFYGCWITSVYITDVSAWCNIDFENYESSPLASEANLYINGELATNVVVPDGVTKIPYCAFAYEGLESIVLPDGITSIADGAFAHCFNLKTINIPESVTSIGRRAFVECGSLISITIPDGVTTLGEEVFMDCESLETITIGNNITSIGGWAFCRCTNLKSITIPDSVTSIGDAAFYKFGGEIYCTKGSTAHKYATSEGVKYVLVNIMGKGSTRVNYNDFIICTNIQQCSNITDIISISDAVQVTPTASHKYDSIELYGSGTTLSVFENGKNSEVFTLVVESDVNGDSVVDVLDCAQVARTSNGFDTLVGAYAIAADSNGDDMVDINDYQSVINKALAS